VAANETPSIRRGAAVSTFLVGSDLSILAGTAFGGIAAKHVGYSSMFLLAIIPVLCGLFIYLMTMKVGDMKKNLSERI
jgi:predicted MFS family arabinose efflux permease